MKHAWRQTRIVVGRIVLGASLASSLLSTPSEAALKVQYRADVGVEKTTGVPATYGDTVLNWLDQSGNNNTASQSTSSRRPTLQHVMIRSVTKPVVRFDGSDDYLQSASNAATFGPSSSLTIFAVVARQGTSPSHYGRLIENINMPNDFEASISLCEGDDYYNRSVAGKSYVGADYAKGSVSTVGVFNVLSAQYDGVNHQVRLYENGNLKQTTSYNTASSANTITTNVTLGGIVGNNIATFFVNADIAEVRIYDTFLNDTDRSAVETELTKTWMIAKGTIFSTY